MQHPLLLDWQQRRPNTDSADFHFKTSISSLLPLSDHDDASPFGDWHYDLGKSWPLLQKKLHYAILPDIDSALLLFAARINRYFPQDFFSRSAENYIALFEEMEEAPDFLIIHSLENILLLFIFRAMQSGDRTRVKKLAALFEQRWPQLKRSKSRWPQLQAFFEAAATGSSAPLPPFGSGIYTDF